MTNNLNIHDNSCSEKVTNKNLLQQNVTIHADENRTASPNAMPPESSLNEVPRTNENSPGQIQHNTAQPRADKSESKSNVVQERGESSPYEQAQRHEDDRPQSTVNSSGHFIDCMVDPGQLEVTQESNFNDSVVHHSTEEEPHCSLSTNAMEHQELQIREAQWVQRKLGEPILRSPSSKQAPTTTETISHRIRRRHVTMDLTRCQSVPPLHFRYLDSPPEKILNFPGQNDHLQTQNAGNGYVAGQLIQAGSDYENMSTDSNELENSQGNRDPDTGNEGAAFPATKQVGRNSRLPADLQSLESDFCCLDSPKSSFSFSSGYLSEDALSPMRYHGNSPLPQLSPTRLSPLLPTEVSPLQKISELIAEIPVPTKPTIPVQATAFSPPNTTHHQNRNKLAMKVRLKLFSYSNIHYIISHRYFCTKFSKISGRLFTSVTKKNWCQTGKACLFTKDKENWFNLLC